MRIKLLYFVFLILTCSPAFGLDPDKLPSRNPDEPTSYTYHQRFSFESAIESARRVTAWLQQFQQLIEIAQKEMKSQSVSKLQLPDWEMRTLGFHNHAMTIQGTLLKQDYEIKQLQYELIVERARSEKHKPGELEEKKKARDQAEQAFLKFWNQFSIYD